MHRDYLQEHHRTQFNTMVLSGNIWTYLSDLNEKVQQRMKVLMLQMKSAQGITEALS